MLNVTCWRKSLAAVVVASICLSLAACSSTPVPPIAKVEPKIDTLFGVEMTDNYYWLRDRGNPEVLAYINAENDYTDAVMKHTEGLQEKLFQECKARIKETDLSVPVKDGEYFYYDREEEGKQYEIYCRKRGSLEAPEQILLDVNAVAEGKDFTDIAPFQPSPDHSMLVYGTDDNGSERYTLHFKNLSTDEQLSEQIPNTSGEAAWANDNKTIFYTVPDEAWRPYQLYRHTLGTDPAKDVLVFQEDDEKFWMSISRTRSGEYLLMETASKVTYEIHYLKADNPQGQLKIIQPREEGLEYTVAHHGNKFYILTNENAVNFKVMTASVRNPSKKNWKELIAHDPNIFIETVEMYDDYMVLLEREDGLRTIRVTDLASNKSHNVAFPEAVYSYRFKIAENPDFRTDRLRLTYQSYVTPKTIYDYNMATHSLELLKRTEVPGGFDPDNYVTERVFATAADGTQIPVSMVYKKGLVKDGSNPLMLYGYGSYGDSMDPWFSVSRPSLLDRGFIYALAHVRGGGEMGRPWYDNGKLLKKKNTFTDFIDCAKYLCEQKYTTAEKTAAVGYSAGGLLTGAVVNMAPEQFGAAIVGVPFVDVMNTMLDASIPLTVVEYDEWGNPNEEEYFHYMLSYSPYDNIAKKDYPHILIESSLNDTRVQYWEGTKYTAKLRALNPEHENRILLLTNMGAGHGGSSGRYDYLRETAFEYAFVLDCMGITE